MSFLNTPDIHDNGQGNVSIETPGGAAANLNITGKTTGADFSFDTMQNTSKSKVLFIGSRTRQSVDIDVTGDARVRNNLSVEGTSTLNGKTSVNSEVDNLPFLVTGAGGQFKFFTSGGQNDGAVIRGGRDAKSGIVFDDIDRIRIEGASGDNRAATLQDIFNIASGRFISASTYNANNLNGMQFVTNEINGYVFQCFVGSIVNMGNSVWRYPKKLNNAGFACPVGAFGNLNNIDRQDDYISFTTNITGPVLIIAAGVA